LALGSALCETPEGMWQIRRMICENAKDTSRSAREDILASAKAVLADYKVPERFEIASEIPRNGMGKYRPQVVAGDNRVCQSRERPWAAAIAAA
jgi:acyl-CoA synthetase (AMP-forming)/AMP-acid ligase II